MHFLEGEIFFFFLANRQNIEYNTSIGVTCIMLKRLKSEEIFSRMVELRRVIHSYPELAFKEEKTAGLIMNELKRLGIPY